MKTLLWSVFIAVVLLEKVLSNECNFDVLERESCPGNGTQHDVKSVCEEDDCCWDTSYNGVPHCFFPMNESTSTNSTIINVTSSSSNFICINCQIIAANTVDQKVDDLADTLENMLSNMGENNQDTVNQKINSTFSGLTQEQSIEMMDKVLLSVQNLYQNNANSSDESLNFWMIFFDSLIKQPSVKTENNSKSFLNVSSEILLNEATSTNLSSRNESSSFRVLNTIENYAISLTTSILGNVIETTNAAKVNLKLPNVTFSSCYENIMGFGCEVENDLAIASVLSVDRSYVTSVTYSTILSSLLFPNIYIQDMSADLGSSVLSLTSHNGENTATSVDVNVLFNLTNNGNVRDGNAVCASFSSSNVEWSGTGCSVIYRNASSASCSCNHNTSFALLFLHTDIAFTREEENFFNIITYVGSGTSITALLLTIFCFFYLRLTKIKRIVLHLNLSSTLCLAQIILLVGTRVTTGTPLCKAIAVLLHFFFMSSFSWMLMEGILLYFQSVRAVKGDVNFKLMIVFGWLLPIIIVGISFASGYDGYGIDRGCWLSIENGLTWAFIGPSLGFILINMILLGLIVKVFLQLKSNAKTGEWHRTKRAIRAILLLTPLLGITWVFGALAVDESTKWFLYLFSICNSLQGLTIFFFHCLHNYDVRKAFLKKYRRSFQNVPPFFSSVNPTTTTTSKTLKTTSGSVSTPSMNRKQWD